MHASRIPVRRVVRLPVLYECFYDQSESALELPGLRILVGQPLDLKSADQIDKRARRVNRPRRSENLQRPGGPASSFRSYR